MDKETKSDLKDMLIKFLVAAAIAFSIVGIATTESWILIPSTTILAGGAGYFASKKNKKAAIGWGIIGLIAGIGFYLAI